MLSGRRKQDYAAETSARPRAAPPPPAPRRPSRSMGSGDLEALLGSVSLFESLDRRALAGLAQQASRRVYAPGVTIVREGDTGTALYGIARGRARVERGSGPATAALGG